MSKGWDRISTSPTLHQSQTQDRVRRVRGGDSLPSPPSWASPWTYARSLCAGHRAPGTAPLLCPQDPADEEPLNSLDFCSGNLWMFLYLPAGHLSWCSEVTAACDTHITFLESNSGLSIHSLLNDFMWVWGLVSHHGPFVSYHVL